MMKKLFGSIARRTAASLAILGKSVTVGALVLTLAGAYWFVPPPRHARAQFADQGAWAGNATLASNVLTITLANVASLNDIVGVRIGLNPSAGNTGPVNVVITNALGSTTPTALQRPSSIGLVALSLNELWASETTSVMYNGSVFVLTSNVDMTPIGHPVEFRGSAAPRGALIEDGSCVSQTQYAALFGVIGTSYNSLAPTGCTGSQFALPDSRGTGFVAFDGQGANGNANRITSASCATPNAIGLCGGQTSTIITANLPPYTPGGSALSNLTGIVNSSGGIAVSNFSFGGAGGNFGTLLAPGATAGQIASTFTGSPQGGSSTPVRTLPPVLPGIRAIKY